MSLVSVVGSVHDVTVISFHYKGHKSRSCFQVATSCLFFFLGRGAWLEHGTKRCQSTQSQESQQRQQPSKRHKQIHTQLCGFTFKCTHPPHPKDVKPRKIQHVDRPFRPFQVSDQALEQNTSTRTKIGKVSKTNLYTTKTTTDPHF